jgi:hypothetical protein
MPSVTTERGRAREAVRAITEGPEWETFGHVIAGQGGFRETVGLAFRRGKQAFAQARIEVGLPLLAKEGPGEVETQSYADVPLTRPSATLSPGGRGEDLRGKGSETYGLAFRRPAASVVERGQGTRAEQRASRRSGRHQGQSPNTAIHPAVVAARTDSALE